MAIRSAPAIFRIEKAIAANSFTVPKCSFGAVMCPGSAFRAPDFGVAFSMCQDHFYLDYQCGLGRTRRRGNVFIVHRRSIHRKCNTSSRMFGLPMHSVVLECPLFAAVLAARTQAAMLAAYLSLGDKNRSNIRVRITRDRT